MINWNSSAGNQKGTALIFSLLIMLVITILSLGAMMNTRTELSIAANSRSALQAFYMAEAGSEEARSRLAATAPLANQIPDNTPTSVNWAAFVGTSSECQQIGYDPKNGNHFLYPRLTLVNLDYATSIRHLVSSGGTVLLWGDSNTDGIPERNTTIGNPIYVINSTGNTSNGTKRTVTIQTAKVPSITTPAALYTKDTVSIQGTSTNVTGIDGCATTSVPGILTTANVVQNGHPLIYGSPQAIVLDPTINLNVQGMIDQFKNYANYSYRDTSYSGKNWGSPTPGINKTSPSSCSDHNIVYISNQYSSVSLNNQSGCGLLLVEGDLSAQGGFSWYGMIVVTGSVHFTGGNMNITGAVISGGTSAIDVVGGNVHIIYCSQAVKSQTDILPPVILSWAELFG